jgi:hypothetical protein
MARVSVVRPSPRAPRSRTLIVGAAHVVREGTRSSGRGEDPGAREEASPRFSHLR